MNITIWALLVVIAVYDAREHRIPNVYLMLLLVLHSIVIITNSTALWHSFSGALLGGVVLFSGALLLYLLKAMAPGDVKFLGVIGFLVGWGNLLAVSYWILLAAGVVALFDYILLKRPNANLLRGFSSVRDSTLSTQIFISERGFVRRENCQKMPFAPSAVLGLALFYYF
ncbi:A24 family peptidase [Vibrio sp. 10N.286.49.B3]|uniref:A24 family peptidase n=1 Tax=Vibrio sp. 10N.286.49.B3 TaxID=1880855 RepID=UPI0012FFEF85|nr:A24 family peptidase [Vibrio sp. 10N.286.49.B3]